MLLAGGQYGGWPEYYPWALPMLVLARKPHPIAAVLPISVVLEIVVSLAGLVEFSRREVS